MSISQQIINHPYFQKLKGIIENNSYHNEESAYDHSITTFHIAQEQLTAPFITNSEAKQAFTDYTQTEIDGITKGNLMQLTALVHDIGKALSFIQNGGVSSILIQKPDGTTQCPGHEYWGSTLIPALLQEILPHEAIAAVAKTVRLHDTYNVSYFQTKEDWALDILINDVKSHAEGNYIECLFNIYCDNYTATPAQESKKQIEELFNQVELYTRRTYTFI